MVGYTNMGSGDEVQTIYKGAVVCIEPDDVDGYVQANLSGLTPDSAFVFAGIALEKKATVAADTGDGDVKIAVAMGGVWAFAVGSTGIAVTDIGAPVYASDDQTLTTSNSAALWIGTIRFVDSDWIWVNIAHAAGRTNTAT